MQGAEAALLLAICSAICVLCIYARQYAAAFLILFFGDFLAIQGKIYFGYQALGVYKEGILLSICCALLVLARQSLTERVFRLFFMLFACGILAISADYRPFSALILAALAGLLIADCGSDIKPPVASLALVCVLICAYQFLNITEFSDLWFYEFLSEKAGEEFLSTYHAYFRNDRLRPPGFLVSPSTFGFVFILFSYLAEKYEQGTVKFLVKLVCFAGLLMIQTRALLIIFMAFELQQRIIPKAKESTLLSYYFSVLIVTLLVTILYGDEGSLVRILLFAGLFSDLASGVAWLPFSSPDTGPVDSQFVSFVRAFGVVGVLYLAYVVRSVKRQYGPLHAKARNVELAFICVLIFVNIFQWSESSPGHLLGWLMLGYFYQKNRRMIERALRQKLRFRATVKQNEPNSIRTSL